jgi:hypothetical protein
MSLEAPCVACGHREDAHGRWTIAVRVEVTPRAVLPISHATPPEALAACLIEGCGCLAYTPHRSLAHRWRRRR